MASIAPAAPNRWPMAPFVDDTLISEGCCLVSEEEEDGEGSMSVLMAAFSALSPRGVEVAWAFM